MSYCPKCGSKIDEEMAFCPKCGAPLKTAQAPTPPRPTYYHRDEKAEKDEKNEKQEKHEKHAYGFFGPLVGGLILLFLGLAFYLDITGTVRREVMWAFFFVVIGIIVIIGAIFGAMAASRRHPKTYVSQP